MASYWKSYEKHFCEICKCWMGGAKSVIQHHENGARHKEAVDNKIKEVGIKRREREVAAKETNQALRQMELGAMQSYRNDLKHAPQVGMTYNVSRNAPTLNYAALRAGRLAIVKPGAPEGMVPGCMKPQKPEMTYKEAEALHEYLHGPDQDQMVGPSDRTTTETIVPKEWAEAKTEDGNVYYWHTTSGETRWDAPAEGFLTETEQATIIANESVVNIGHKTLADKVEKKQKEEAYKQSTSRKRKSVQEEYEYETEQAPQQLFDHELGYMVDNTEATNYTSAAPSADYTVQAYSTDPEHTAEPVDDPQLAILPQTDVKVKEEDETPNKFDDYQKPPHLLTPEEIAKRIADFKQDKMFKRQKANDPYGSTWSTVQETKPEVVDFGLPKMNEEAKAVLPSKKEDRTIKFKEKTISIKMSKSSEPVSFNKRKSANRRLRARDDED